MAHLSRMEPVAPGASAIACRVLVQRLRELDPGRDLADAVLLSEAEAVGGRPVIGWQLERLDAFLAELRPSDADRGGSR